jgi:hypothetical protein
MAKEPGKPGAIRKFKFDKSGVKVLPWREAWAEAGEPWIEHVWGQRSPQGEPATTLKPRVSVEELWLRFVSESKIAKIALVEEKKLAARAAPKPRPAAKKKPE